MVRIVFAFVAFIAVIGVVYAAVSPLQMHLMSTTTQAAPKQAGPRQKATSQDPNTIFSEEFFDELENYSSETDPVMRPFVSSGKPRVANPAVTPLVPVKLIAQ